MRHRVKKQKLGVKASHRKALKRNLVTSLFKFERIETTRAKAKAIQADAEKMITRAKVDSVHNRRIIDKDIKDKAVLNKLFTDIAPRFAKRNGGYTRILKLGYRNNDAAEMVLLELVVKQGEEDNSPKKSKESKPAKKESTKKEDIKVEEVKVETKEAEVKEEANNVEVKDEAKAEEPKEEEKAEVKE